MIDRDMACKTCTYALVAIDGDDGTVTYQHPVVPLHPDHDPVPVPAHQLPQVYRRCHLCSLDEPVWIYRVPEIEAMSIGGTHPVTQTYSTQWHTCIPCSQSIENDDHVAVTRRSIAAIGWATTDPRAGILAGIHRAIVLTRDPGRTLLTTGAWQPAPLKAATLPKVRDRLTALLRGPAGLPPPLHRAEPRRLLADGLDQAKLYWIDPQFTTLVAQVLTDLPDTTITGRIVPTDSGLLTWSTPVGHRHHLTAASWTPTGDGWQIACYRSLGPDLPPADLQQVRHDIGWLVPVHVTRVHGSAPVNGDDPLAALVASWLIIAQQLTHQNPVQVDTPIRRAYARAHRPAPEVHLVRIKPGTPRPAPTTPIRTRTGRAKPDHRFWVSGHERNQAYGPGRALRKTILVDPFLKGPEGAPIRASTTVRVLGTSRRPPVERSGRPSTDHDSME